jgi:NAD(P)-dependent dehydrogenase (short-subunit alcohol dehydrogenase family)
MVLDSDTGHDGQAGTDRKPAAAATAPLDGRTVVVSGVGGGLGRKIAAAALRDGARVVLGARTGRNLQAVAAELDPDGARVAYRTADVTRPDQCAELAALAVDRFGTLDALVNCAALDTVLGGLHRPGLAGWQDVFEANFAGSLEMTRAAVPYLRRQGGAVVFIGSQTMLAPPPDVPQLLYAGSKAALLGAARHLAAEVGRFRIRVNTVVPGWMWGPSVQQYVELAAAAQGRTAEEVVAELTSDMPLPDMATDGDVAEAVVFLASDRARAITGQSLLVNAGQVMQ